MNILLAEPEEIHNNHLCLTDNRAEHIVKVLRSAVGDRVRVGVINGSKGTGTILALKKKYPFSVELDISLSAGLSSVPPLDLILALPRPIMLKRIFSQAAALGVGSIHLIHANRVEKSFWEASILQEVEYRLHLLQGLEQAVDTRIPQVYIHPKFKPFIEDFFPGQRKGYSFQVLAHPSGTTKLATTINEQSSRGIVAIGPEGGWVDYEVDKFKEQGFINCTIGERILKVDTAVVALHSRIIALLEARCVS